MAVALRLPDSATLEPFGAKQRSTNLKVRIDPLKSTVSYSQQTQQLPRLRSSIPGLEPGVTIDLHC